MASRAYLSALDECRKHHESSKTYSGKLLRPHAPFIKKVIDRHGCKSALDFGAGKGSQYRWICDTPTGSIPVGMTIEQYWGLSVTKYDPAYPPFSAEPEGKYDLVICTHVLGSIPDTDLEWVIDRLHGLAGKALYVAEKIGPVKKRVVPVKHRTADDWASMLRRDSGIEVTLATRIRTPDRGVIMERRVL
jgi:hypothetical protein